GPPGGLDVANQKVEVQIGELRPGGVTANRLENLLKPVGNGMERLTNLGEHLALFGGEGVRFLTTPEEVVGSDEKVLDVVGIRGGHDADTGIELALKLEGLALGGLGGQLLFQEPALCFVLKTRCFLAAKLGGQGLALRLIGFAESQEPSLLTLL